MTQKYSQAFIDEHRDINVHHRWQDSVYKDFYRICEILGVDLDKGEPSFSGFWSQGDGASWTGRYRAMALSLNTRSGYVPTYESAPAQIREYAPQDETLHSVADELCMLGRIYCPAYAEVSRDNSHYVHENTMMIDDVELYYDSSQLADEVIAALEEALLVQFRELAGWFYATLETEYEYLTSDEAVIETLEANDIEEEEVQ